jgi:hypothetical protein
MAAATAALAACSDPPASPRVPNLPGGTGASASAGAGGGGGGKGDDRNAGRALNGATGDAGTARRTALHNAAECIRQHGAPNYPDPVLTADGRVYTDERGLHDAIDENGLDAVETACGELIRAAKFSPDDQAPPPPRLVQAGVKSAGCLRAHGLPDYPDPTAGTSFVPGKGFGLDGTALPAAGKADPTVQQALGACRSILDEESRLSSLGSLADA